MLERTLQVYPDDSARTLHLVANQVIDVDGDRASAESTWCYVTRDDADNPVLELVGHYRDRLARVEGGWLFVRREAYRDMPYFALDVTA
jgi:hypothetical protein